MFKTTAISLLLMLICGVAAHADTLSFTVPEKSEVEMQLYFRGDTENVLTLWQASNNQELVFNSKKDKNSRFKTSCQTDEVFTITGAHKKSPDGYELPSPGKDLSSGSKKLMVFGFDDTNDGYTADNHYSYKNAVLVVTVKTKS